jgi:hypothetical protein
MEQITQLITYLALVSVAAERAVDMIKRTALATRIKNGAVYQGMSFLAGAAFAAANPPNLTFIQLNPTMTALLVGLAVSGGSSAWHEILATLSALGKRSSVEGILVSTESAKTEEKK